MRKKKAVYHFLKFERIYEVLFCLEMLFKCKKKFPVVKNSLCFYKSECTCSTSSGKAKRVWNLAESFSNEQLAFISQIILLCFSLA